MKKNKNMQVENIDGIDPSALTRVIIEDGNGNIKWAIKNSYGKITPFFVNGFHKFAYDNKSFLFIGETDGFKILYAVKGAENENSPLYTVVDTIGNLSYVTRLNRTDAIITTDLGEYLFDIENLRQKSDIFDAMIVLNNRLVFKKNVSLKGTDNIYYGEVGNDGRIGHFLYDNNNDDFVTTPIDNTTNSDYDLIDDAGLEEMYAKSVDNKTKIKKSKMQMLFRLNGVSRN